MCRFVLGITFIFSGFVKAVDPLGSFYKIRDYLEAFGLSAWVPWIVALFFGIGLANYLLGLAVYYGVLSWVTQLVQDAAARFPAYTYGVETTAGLVCAVIGIFLIQRTRRSSAET